MSVTTTPLDAELAETTDSDFDLDLKLQPVARNGSADRPQRPTMCSCVECDTSAQTCSGACPPGS
jgi:hypothetical protein